MNVKTQAEADALNERIKTEMGVDISMYRDEEVIETLSELIVFPVYALRAVIRPVVLFLILWLLGFWLWDLVHVEYLLYGLIGLVLFLITGFFAGIIWLTITFRGDIMAMMNYSMDILKGIVADVDKLNSGSNKGNLGSNLTLLFAGVVHIITIPAAGSIISGKIPFIGGYVSGLFTSVLRRLANIFKWPELKRSDAVFAAGEEGKILPIYLNSVTTFQTVIGRILGVAMRVVQLPVGMVLLFVASITAGFVWLLN